VPANDFLDSTDYAADTNLTDTAASATRIFSASRGDPGSLLRASHINSGSLVVSRSRRERVAASVRRVRTRGDIMYRLLALLALAASSVGCACCQPGYGNLWGCGSGCGSECGCACEDPYGGGCEDPYACGGGCGDACGDGSCGEYGGCEPSCGCGSECGQGGCGEGGCCAHVFRDCPLCQGSCCLFRRYCADGCYDECSQCGATSDCGPYGADYDYSACENCHGHGRGRCCCGCCETYTGCCAPCCKGQGPGCCASGDHQYNFNPGPPTGQVAYPYYTVRGPRDFLAGNPPPIGPY
jgi:hypothetical protein